MMNEEYTFYPIAIFILDKKNYKFQKSQFNYDFLIFHPEDKTNLPQKTKIGIGIIISDFKGEEQTEKALNIISTLKQNNIKSLVFSQNKVPTAVEETSYIAEGISKTDIELFLKILDCLVFKPCLVGVDYNDVINIFSKNKGNLSIYEILNLNTDLKQLKEYLPNSKPKKSFIIIELGLDLSYIEAEDLITKIIDFLQPKQILFQVCLNENLSHEKINLYTVLIDD